MQNRLQKLLYKPDGQPVEEPDWWLVFKCLGVLVNCCSATASLRERSQGDSETLFSCIFGMTILEKESLQRIVREISGHMDARQMVKTLTVIVEYLCDSELARARVSGDFLEAVVDVVEYAEAAIGEQPWDEVYYVQSAVAKLKKALEKYEVFRGHLGTYQARLWVPELSMSMS